MDTLNWDDILYDLANNRAVLLIGHDLLPHQGESVYDDLHQKLIQNTPHGIDYYPLRLPKDSQKGIGQKHQNAISA